MGFFLLKDGPLLEKFSGSAPDMHGQYFTQVTLEYVFQCVQKLYWSEIVLFFQTLHVLSFA